MVSKITSEDYRALLEAASEDAEDEINNALLAERLNTLGLGDSEAVQAAVMADPPRVRQDGQVVGIGRPKPPLSDSAIRFAQGVIEGKSRRQAYREAYDAKGSDASVSAAAAKLMRDPRVQKLIDDGWSETTEALADDAVATKRYVMRSLVTLSKVGKQEGTRLKALELLGKASGVWREQASATEQPVTAEQLRKELATHLRLVSGSGKV